MKKSQLASINIFEEACDASVNREKIYQVFWLKS